MTKPTQLPEWASEDQVDGVSGQPNVAEPSTTKKEAGWEREELPPRQWLNWWQRLVYRWIEWIDTELSALIANAARRNTTNTFTQNQTVNATLAANALTVNGNAITGGSGEFTAQFSGFTAGNLSVLMRYSVANGVVTIHVPAETVAESNSTSMGSVGTPLPAAIRPAGIRRPITLVRSGTGTAWRLGAVVISSSGSISAVMARIPGFDTTAIQFAAGGFNDTGNKGFPEGATFSYRIAN